MFNQKTPGTFNFTVMFSKVGDFLMYTVFDSGWQARKMDVVVIIGYDGI